MSGRRGVSVKAPPASLLKTRTSTATPARKEAFSDSSDQASFDSFEAFAWWKESKGQVTIVMSVVSIVILYGATFSMPSIGYQSVQLVVAITLFAISLLNFTHYLSGRQKRAIENLNVFRGSRTLPPFVKQDKNGSYFISQWKPSSYTESIALNYNPVVPVMAYVWCRSFEPFAGWLCVFSIIAVTGILHLLMTRMKFLLRQEKLFHVEAQEPSFSARAHQTEPPVPSNEHFDHPEHVHQKATSPKRAYREYAPPQESHLLEQEAFEPNQRRSPYAVDSHADPGDRVPLAQQYRVETVEGPVYEPVAPKTNFGPPGGRTPLRAAAYPLHMNGPASVHIEKPAQTPSRAPQRAPFGLRCTVENDRPALDPQPAQDDYPAPAYANTPYEHANMQEPHRSPPVYQQTPTQKGKMAAPRTPFGAAPPPPSYSLQDFS